MTEPDRRDDLIRELRKQVSAAYREGVYSALHDISRHKFKIYSELWKNSGARRVASGEIDDELLANCKDTGSGGNG